MSQNLLFIWTVLSVYEFVNTFWTISFPAAYKHEHPSKFTRMLYMCHIYSSILEKQYWSQNWSGKHLLAINSGNMNSTDWMSSVEEGLMEFGWFKHMNHTKMKEAENWLPVFQFTVIIFTRPHPLFVLLLWCMCFRVCDCVWKGWGVGMLASMSVILVPAQEGHSAGWLLLYVHQCHAMSGLNQVSRMQWWYGLRQYGDQ